jgi:hypothetical protein
MACCGESGAGRLTITQRQIDEGLTLQIEYSGGRTMTVNGPVTGRQYVFSGLQRLQDVDPRDAPGILRERLFRVKGIKRGKN